MLYISLNNVLVYGFFSCLVIYYLILIYKYRRLLKFAWSQNGFFLPILPLVGNGYLSLIASIIYMLPVNVLTFIQWLHKNLGHPINLWIGSDYYYITNNPSEIKIIVNHPKCYNKANIYKPLTYFFGNSILLASAKEWKAKRKYLQTSYKPTGLKYLFPTFYKESCNLIKSIQRLNKGDDLLRFFSVYAYTVTFLTSAGFKEESSFPDLKTFGEQIKKVQKILSLSVIYPYISFNLWTRFFSMENQVDKATKVARDIVGKLIQQKRNKNTKRQDPNEAEQAVLLFDLIINDNSKQLTDKEIFEEIFFFTAAAIETNGHALAFCFTLLGMYPDIQETLYNEIMDKIGFKKIVYEDLAELQYTEAVIMETLRLFPPVPFVGRNAEDDVDLGTKVIPKGANIILDIFHLQRDDKYWPNPLVFDPTRFLPENSSKIIIYAYLPFSGGPKECIGKAQAMTVLKTTVANVIRTYKPTSKYKSIDEIILTSAVTLQSAKTLDCQFTRRLQE